MFELRTPPPRTTYDSRTTSSAIERLSLAVLIAFTGAAILGYATFGRHPELVTRVPNAGPMYGIAFTLFSRVQVLLAFAVIALVMTRRVGARWLPAFVALYALSLGSEMLGTTIGIPFGPYRYTEALGVKWFGHVPLVIPLSWFFMAVPSYALARAALPERDRVIRRVVLASLILTSWDLVLDPAMSRVTSYWVWSAEGVYYGMPALNLLGWYVTGLVLMTALAWLRAEQWIERLPLEWVCAFYAANLLLPVGLAAAAGLWPALLTTAAALAGCALLARVLARRTQHAALAAERS